MRYLQILGFCLVPAILLGCNTRAQEPAAPPAEEGAPARQPAPTGTQPESADGGFNLGVDVGDGGVHVETDGPGEESGVEVDVGPQGQVDVGEKEE